MISRHVILKCSLIQTKDLDLSLSILPPCTHSVKENSRREPSMFAPGNNFQVLSPYSRWCVIFGRLDWGDAEHPDICSMTSLRGSGPDASVRPWSRWGKAKKKRCTQRYGKII